MYSNECSNKVLMRPSSQSLSKEEVKSHRPRYKPKAQISITNTCRIMLVTKVPNNFSSSISNEVSKREEEEEEEEEYVLKMVNNDSSEIKEYFYRERSIRAVMNYPNILKIYRCFKFGKYNCFLLKYEPNGSLRDLMEAMKAVENYPREERFLLGQFIFAEVVTALKYIHIEKVVHGDLKPENILLSKDFHIRLCDFGISKFTKGNSITDFDHENNKACGGTEFYASPEQLNDENGSKITSKTDLWSLGCIIYEFFHGFNPFCYQIIDDKGSTDEKMRYNLKPLSKEQAYRNIREAKYSFPKDKYPSVVALCTELLKKESKDRKACAELEKSEFFNGVLFRALEHRIAPISHELQKKLQEELNKKTGESFIAEDIIEDEGPSFSAYDY